MVVPLGVKWPNLVEIEKYLIPLPVKNAITSPKVGGTLYACCEGPMRLTDFRFSSAEATPRVLKKLARGNLVGCIPELLRIFQKLSFAHLTL